MGVTSQQFSDASDKDLQSHNESFRPDQEEKGNKSNCSRTPTNHKHAAKWNQPIISSHEGDIAFLKQRILHLLYLEAHRFWRLQTYHWRPGDFMILLQTSYNILGCTNMHRIKWIKLEPNFPFSDPFDINGTFCDWVFLVFQMDAKNNLTYDEPEEIASPKLTDWLKSSTPWRSPIRHGSVIPSTPLARQFDSTEFTLKKDCDDFF